MSSLSADSEELEDGEPGNEESGLPSSDLDSTRS